MKDNSLERIWRSQEAAGRAVTVEPDGLVKTLFMSAPKAVTVIRDGYVRVQAEDGDAIATILGPGHVLRYVPGQVAIAHTEAQVCWIPSITGYLSADDASWLQDQQERQMNWFSSLLQGKAMKDNAVGKVQAFLRLLVEAYGLPTEDADWQQLAFPLTHKDISQMIGSTRVTVTRSMAQLRKQGCIATPSVGTTLVRV